MSAQCYEHRFGYCTNAKTCFNVHFRPILAERRVLLGNRKPICDFLLVNNTTYILSRNDCQLSIRLLLSTGFLSLCIVVIDVLIYSAANPAIVFNTYLTYRRDHISPVLPGYTPNCNSIGSCGRVAVYLIDKRLYTPSVLTQ